MPAATDKRGLITVTVREHGRLDALIAPIDERRALNPDADGISIKDVIGHRAHWIDLFLGWVADGRAGRPVHIPAKGYKWNQLADFNARLRADQADLGWDRARALLADRHARLMAFLEAEDDAGLYGAPMPGQGKWTTGRFAEAAGAGHYRSAGKFIRARLRAAQSG